MGRDKLMYRGAGWNAVSREALWPSPKFPNTASAGDVLAFIRERYPASELAPAKAQVEAEARKHFDAQEIRILRKQVHAALENLFGPQRPGPRKGQSG
jgi:hypothetical protein